MQTLLLDTVSWDLVLDLTGNMAVASNPYSLAQDAASACRVFEGEAYYDTSIGIPYWASILGKSPSISLMKSAYVSQALTVPDVVSAAFFISSFGASRVVNGQIQVTDSSGVTLGANV